MASIFDAECPNCGEVFDFCKWDAGFQEFGNVTCPECETEFNVRSREIVQKSLGYKLSERCLKAIDDFLLNSLDVTEEEREEIIERLG